MDFSNEKKPDQQQKLEGGGEENKELNIIASIITNDDSEIIIHHDNIDNNNNDSDGVNKKPVEEEGGNIPEIIQVKDIVEPFSATGGIGGEVEEENVGLSKGSNDNNNNNNNNNNPGITKTLSGHAWDIQDDEDNKASDSSKQNQHQQDIVDKRNVSSSFQKTSASNNTQTSETEAPSKNANKTTVKIIGKDGKTTTVEIPSKNSGAGDDYDNTSKESSSKQVRRFVVKPKTGEVKEIIEEGEKILGKKVNEGIIEEKEVSKTEELGKASKKPDDLDPLKQDFDWFIETFCAFCVYIYICKYIYMCVYCMYIYICALSFTFVFFLFFFLGR
jgi:hypothetical protein